MRDVLFPMNLQLFAEGGAPSGDGGGEGTGVTAQAAAVQSKGVKSNPLANVVYGKQKESAPAAEVQKEEAPKEEPAVELDAEFEELIKGKYKDQYGKRVQNTVQQRLKGTKETEDRLNAMNPLMDLLSARYGVKADDIDGLTKALEGDDTFFEQAAQEHNMDAKEYRKMLQLQSENTRLKSQQEQQFRQEQINKQYEQWEQQAEEARKLYPTLDLNVESQNPQFRQLLMSGIDVKTAYKVLHDDEITTQLLQHQAKEVEKKMSNKIAAGNARPAENGSSGQSAAVIKSDPSKWTKADREEVRRRAARGERIYL